MVFGCHDTSTVYWQNTLLPFVEQFFSKGILEEEKAFFKASISYEWMKLLFNRFAAVVGMKFSNSAQ